MVVNNHCQLTLGGPKMPHSHTLIEQLREHGLKLTPQRHLICQLIETTHGHPTVEDLYEKATAVMPSMSLKTVYTALYELAGLGAIRLVNVGTGGFRVESNLDPHSHLVCRRCGKVMDVPVDPAATADLSVLEQYDFEVEHREVIFRGLCGDCAQAGARRDQGHERHS